MLKVSKIKSKKLVYGVGLNDADYVVQVWETVGYVNGRKKQKLIWICPFYQAWVSMLGRCYSAKYQERRPTYKGCTVSEDWLTFSNFKSWMEQQDWEGKQLDKDLLFEGNKIYSDETCVFVDGVVNSFMLDRGSARGEWPIGVCVGTRRRVSLCHSVITRSLRSGRTLGTLIVN